MESEKPAVSWLACAFRSEFAHRLVKTGLVISGVICLAPVLTTSQTRDRIGDLDRMVMTCISRRRAA